MIRLTAVGYLLFFVPDLVLASTHHVSGLPPVLARLFDWGAGGPNGQAIAVMFSTPRTPRTSPPCSSWPSQCVSTTHHGAVGGVLASGPAP
jgi:hypothetical protein